MSSSAGDARNWCGGGKGWLIAVALIALGSCTTRPTATDTGAVGDLPVAADASRRTSDGSDGAAPADASVDFPRPSDALPDFPLTDAVLASATALYAVGPSADDIGLRRVGTDGKGKPASVAGFGGLIDFDDLELAGMQPSLPVPADHPRIFAGFVDSIVLPDDRGALYYVHRTVTGTSGILQVSPDGKVRLLVEVAGLYADTIAPQLAVGAKGRVAAGIVNDDRLALMRCDGTTFSGGKSAVLLSAPSGVSALLAPSITMVGSTLLVVGRTSAGDHRLLAAPIDGSKSSLTGVSLPASGGASVSYVGSDITGAGAGGYAALRAGASASKIDLYRLDVRALKAINVTNKPAAIAARGKSFGEDEAQLALSPKGGKVAYVLQTQPTATLIVRAADGSGSATVLSGKKFFQSGQLSNVANLFFSDETHLWFMAGVNAAQLDVYSWEASTDKMTNHTGFGSTKPPFDAQGGFAASGAWIAPGDKWLYVAAADLLSATRDLLAVPLSGAAVRSVTKDRRISMEDGAMASCAGSHDVLLIARPNAARARQAVWRFDQSSATAAQQLTAVPGVGSWSAGTLSPADRSCSQLLWSAGSTPSQSRLWTVRASKPLSESLVTPVPRTIGSRILLTPDGSSVIFASGGSASALTLKAVLRSGGRPTTLDTKAGVVEPLAVY